MKSKLFRQLFEQLDATQQGRVCLEDALKAPVLDPQLRLDLTDAVAIAGDTALDLHAFQVLFQGYAARRILSDRVLSDSPPLGYCKAHKIPRVDPLPASLLLLGILGVRNVGNTRVWDVLRPSRTVQRTLMP
eukprot:623820-Prorocentrum_minimum.AAC.1